MRGLGDAKRENYRKKTEIILASSSDGLKITTFLAKY